MMAHVPSPDIHTITDPTDERLADYVSLTDVALRSRHEPSKGLYIAESSTVLRRALAAGHRPRSVLLSPRWLPDLVAMLASLPDDGTSVPVYVAEPDVLEAITGFHVHRGALASMHRPPLPSVHDLLSAARGGTGARRVAILEDIVDHTNVGAIFRSAAGLGVDAVLVTPRCADPLYRRSVRVSMGTVLRQRHYARRPERSSVPQGSRRSSTAGRGCRLSWCRSFKSPIPKMSVWSTTST